MAHLKYEKLINTLKSMGKVAVAFSGGVDSAFLLKAAMEALGRENVLSITVKSQVVTDTEIKDIETLAKLLNARHLVLKMDIFSLPQFKSNLIDRCYFCKKHIFKEIIKAASQRGFDIIIDGTNADDEGDFRPGMKALAELKVKSPLKDCGLTKEDIRELSKELGLPTYNKPSLACLASRIPYNEEITIEKLKMIAAGENYLRDLGFNQIRVRCHGSIARIELLPEDLHLVFENNLNIQINNYFSSLGFKYVTLDLEGYRTGSLNEDVIKNG